MEFILILGCITALFYFNSRIIALEKRIDELQSGVPHREQPTPMPATQMAPLSEKQQVIHKEFELIKSQEAKTHSFTPQQTTPVSNSVGDWLKEDFFVKLGAFLLLLALGWFVSYAFANNWIGPAGRITLGLIIGMIFMIVGVWRIRTHAHQGSIFTVLGATTVLLTIYAAREMYDFFTPLSALIVMLVSVVFVTFVSVRYQREQLAVAGLVLGAIAPLLTAAPAPDAMSLFLYLIVIVYGTLWVVFLTGWVSLTAVSLTIVFLYGLPFITTAGNSTDKDVALAFALVFVGTFFVTNVLSLIRRAAEPLHPAHLFTAAGTAVYLVSWIGGAVDAEWQSLLFVFWSLVFGLGSYLVYRFTYNRIAFYIYASTGVVLIGAATAAELSGPVLTIAFIIEISALLMVAAILRVDRTILSNLSVLYVVPILLSLESVISKNWNQGIIHSDFVVLFLLTLCLCVVGLFFQEKAARDAEKDATQTLETTLFVLSGCYAVALVWLSFHALMTDDVATFFALVLYTIAGLTLFISGKQSDKAIMKTAGAVLVGLVVGRLLFVDVWDMSLAGRIITFFIIGVMLVSTAFIRKSTRPTDTN